MCLFGTFVGTILSLSTKIHKAPVSSQQTSTEIQQIGIADPRTDRAIINSLILARDYSFFSEVNLIAVAFDIKYVGYVKALEIVSNYLILAISSLWLFTGLSFDRR